MRLREVFVEGVPATKGVLEYRFESTLNPWKQKGTFPLESLVEILLTLFYPQTREKEPLGPGKARKAAVTIEAREHTFRLTRDYLAKKTILAEMEPGPQCVFRDLSSESRFIAETLNRSVKLPSQKIFRNLLICQPGKSEWVASDSGANSNESFSQSNVSFSDLNTGQRLRALQQERRNLQMVKEAESRVDELQSALFRIDDELRKLVSPRENVKRILSEFKSYAKFEREGLVTPQIISKLNAYPSQCEQRDLNLKALEENVIQWTAELAQVSDRKLWSEPALIAGAALAISGFIASSFQRKYLWISLPLSILGILIAGVGAYLGHQRLERLAAKRKQVKNVDAERAGIEKRFEIETAAVTKLCEEVGEKDTAEILELIERWKALRSELTSAEKKLKETEEKVSESQLLEQKEEIKSQITALERQLSDIPPVSVDPHVLDQQINELEAIMNNQSAPSVVSPSSNDSNASKGLDAVSNLVALTASLSGRLPLEIVGSCQKALDANVASFTNRKFSGVFFALGSFTEFNRSDGSRAQWISLDADAKRLLFFAVQFTLWQWIASGQSYPFFIDMLSFSVPDSMSALTLAAARHLAKKSQVVVLSP